MPERHNATAPEAKATIFTSRNRHAPSCGTPPRVDASERGQRRRHHGYFENEHGEQAIALYDQASDQLTLWMGDADWERPRRIPHVSRLGDAQLELAVGALLTHAEQVWLRACLLATAPRREHPARDVSHVERLSG